MMILLVLGIQKVGVCMGGAGRFFAFFGPAPHLCGLEISNPQTALNKDNPCGADILSGIYVILILLCKK
jgi:hypothetical protein